MIKLGKLKIDPAAIASSGNAILGIRDSGKTYTATLLAERLFASGIPFVAFDPIGVWRFLRVPGKGPGIPVVVAGGTDGDLPLTVAGAPEIVRAAMANGVSLVIDLFDINLSKADWKRIVTACVRVLLHENSKHGLRHVFIEEAAEFAPQRVGPDQGQVYAEMEKLARMGGNSRLGYTLINQRAEEVNKALLELCDNLFLHRQKGRNSLTALSKWLDIGNVAAAKEIISTLPTLPTGECWAWMQGSEVPELVKIPAKDSLHPDRRIMRGDTSAPAAKAVDVGKFVATMKGTLGDIEQEVQDLKSLRGEVKRLTGELDAAKREAGKAGVPEAEVQRRIREAVAAVPRYQSPVKMLALLAASAKKLYESIEAAHLTAVAADERAAQAPARVPNPVREATASPAPRERQAAPSAAAVSEGLTAPKQLILDVMAQLEACGIETPNKLMIAAHAGVSPKSSGYANNLGALRSAGLIDYPAPGCAVLTADGRARANAPTIALTLDELHESFLRVLTAPQASILRCALEAYPKSIERTDLAVQVGVSAASSGYANNLGSLRTLGAIEYPERGAVRAARILFPEGIR